MPPAGPSIPSPIEDVPTSPKGKSVSRKLVPPGLSFNPLPEKELRLLFDVNDTGKKGYLTKAEFFKVLERIRKRDRITVPFPLSILESVFFLLDPVQNNKVSWERFRDKFNDLFWKHRDSFYESALSTTPDALKPAGVFAQSQLSFKSKAAARGRSLSHVYLSALSSAPSEEFHSVNGQPQPEPVAPSASLIASEEPLIPLSQRSFDPLRTPRTAATPVRRSSVAPFSSAIPLGAQLRKSSSLASEPATGPPISPRLGKGPSLLLPSSFRDDVSARPSDQVTSAKQEHDDTMVPSHGALNVPSEMRPELPKFPQVQKEQLLNRLTKVPGLPELSDGTRWVGRYPGVAQQMDNETNTFFYECPHCGKPIDPHVLQRQGQEYETFRPPFSHVVPCPSFTCVPLYGPYFYAGMWKCGKLEGRIPPSFFNSPYNIHTWVHNKRRGFLQ